MRRIWLALALAALAAVVPVSAEEPIGDAGLAAAGGVQPALACDAAGRVYLAYGADKDGERQVFLRTSDDAGKNWSEPELVSEGAVAVMAGNTRGPQIAVSGDTLVITAFAKFKKSDDNHLFCFRRRAKDKRFTAVRVSAKSKDMEGLHHMTVDAEGTIHVVWMDSRNGGAEPWYAASNTEGKSFKGEASVYTAPDKSICPCCQPTVAASGKTVVVQFRNKLKGLNDGQYYNDMYAAVSSDGGRKWKTAPLDDRDRWKG